VLASVSSTGSQGGNPSWLGWGTSISDVGRYIAFFTTNSNMVIDDTNGYNDVFVRDRQTGETTRVSVSSTGSEGNGNSWYASINGNGRYVALRSIASNLVSDDTNGYDDVFVHDAQTGQMTRVSVSSGGVEGNGNSLSPRISSDGRYVAFISSASNLVPGDTNGDYDVFVHDQQTGETTRVSLSSTGEESSTASEQPVISADGRYVAFTSKSNLIPGGGHSSNDVFVRDRQTGITTRVSVSSGGLGGDDSSTWPSISGDGRYVAFRSEASNLVEGDTNGYVDVFVHDQQTGETTLVSVSSGGLGGNGQSQFPSINGDGRYVAFSSWSSNLVLGDTNNTYDIFVHDRQTGETSRASVSSTGVEIDNGDDSIVSISSDGFYIAFESVAGNLVSGDTNGQRDIFVAVNPLAE